MRRQHVIGGLVGLAIVAGLLTAVIAFVYPTKAQRENRPQFGPDESQPIADTFVGKTREELIASLGEPTQEGPWFIGLPTQEFADRYKGTKTLEWHWESGRFLASVHPVNGQSICYASYWMPKGWEF
jgi:hypothetical protein